VSFNWFAHAPIRITDGTPALVGDHLDDNGPPDWAWQSILNDPPSEGTYADLTHTGATFRSDTIRVPLLAVPGTRPDSTVPWDAITTVHVVFLLSGPVGQRLVWDLFSNPGGWQVGGQVTLAASGATFYDLPLDPFNNALFYSGAATATRVRDLLHTDMPAAPGLSRDEVWLRLFTNAIPGNATIRVHTAQVYWQSDAAPAVTLAAPAGRLSGRMDGRGPLGGARRLDTVGPAHGPLSVHPGAPGSYY
jgi:hypothetical protein